MSIVIFKRHGYNTKALKSIASKRFINNKILKSKISFRDFDKLPSWIFIQNKEFKISSTEIRNEREKFRGKN